MRRLPAVLAVLAFLLAPLLANAAAVDLLKEFVRDVKSGRAQFTQTVTSPDGLKKRTSSGSFEFARPNRFRFAYTRPFEQLIVADGQRVWIFDADLNQASSRKITQALGATPAALLAGGALESDFELSNLPSAEGLDWALALPRAKEGTFLSMKVGFKGKELSAVEIIDALGQKSVLQFSQFAANPSLGAERFQFTPPKGADVIEQ